MPAIDVGTSVSRVGGRTQAPALRELTGTLRLDYAQFLELEMFTRFGGLSDARVKAQMVRGMRTRAVLIQPRFVPLRLVDEVALAFALREGLLDTIPIEAVALFRQALPGWLDVRPTAEYAAGHIRGARSLPPDEVRARLRTIPKDAEIVAYCRGPFCVYADDAVRALHRRGIRARRLEDGFPEWERAGLPIAAGTEG